MTIDGGTNPLSGAEVALRELGAAGRLVAEEILLDRQQRRRTDRVVLAMLGVVAAAVIAVGWMGWSSYSLNRTVADCTVPAGACYQDNRQQAATNRSALTRANLAIVSCARTASTEEALTRCVRAELVAEGIDITLINPDAEPVGPPPGSTIAPPGAEQPDEPAPMQPPARPQLSDDPADQPGDTGGTS